VIEDPVAFFRKVKDDTGIDFLGRGDRSGGGGGRPPPQQEAPARINENETYGLSPAFLAKLNVSTPLERRVFVTNVSYNCGVGRLFDIFSLAGRITWIDLQLDKDGKTKGICVVEYSHPIEAVQAISMIHNQRIFDRTISVKMDKFPREGENRRDGDLPFGLHSVGMGLGANGAPLTDVAGVISSLSSASAPFPHQNGSAMASAVPSSIPPLSGSGSYSAPNPYVSPQQPVQQSYQTISSSYIKPEPDVLPSMGAGNYGSIAQTPVAPVPSPMGAQSTQSGYFGGGTQYQQQAQQYRPVQYSSGGTTTIGGVQQQQPQQSQHWRNSSCVILIKNLPADYSWQIVSDRVQQFGDLESVEIVSPGVAKIRFMHLKDAERAMSILHGVKVEDRTIKTEYL